MLKHKNANVILINKNTEVFIQTVLENTKFIIAPISKSKMPINAHFIGVIFLSAISEKNTYEISISKKYTMKDEMKFSILSSS